MKQRRLILNPALLQTDQEKKCQMQFATICTFAHATESKQSCLSKQGVHVPIL